MSPVIFPRIVKEQDKKIYRLGILLCCLLIILPIVGCSSKEKDNSVVRSSNNTYETALTLPQVPKLTVPFKPTNKDIQIALRNAGFYNGEIDGDIGPMTEQAIRQFQRMHNLSVDGKVGPKTWSVLKKYYILMED